ncbi:GNAT family N-acetyltransferase [Paracoccus solventivorans]|nr:GNAT family N-acetyltransferase [Paracoccus solventivorans]
MTPQELAALHCRCFTVPRPWTAAEFAALLPDSGTMLHTSPQGFLLGRIAGDEAELLTLAVAPEARGQGEGRALVRRFLKDCSARGAVAVFLEVAADNAAAIGLYRATGWRQVGQRRSYYAPGLDALVMRHDLAG